MKHWMHYSMEVKLFAATKALIEKDGKILILREHPDYVDGVNPGMYSLPGGRVEPGEHFEESLRREIMEETGMTVKIGSPVHVDEWRPVVHGKQWQIIGTFFICTVQNTEVTLSNEHDSFEWIHPEEVDNYMLSDVSKKAIKAFRENVFS